MTETPTLIETSFADAIAIIAAALELSEHVRIHWPSSMRQVAKFIDRSTKDIPARYSAIRAHLSKLHHAPAGLTAKTLQNHKSNTKSALLWLAREKGVPEHGAPLTAAWETLRAGVKDRLVRSRLSSIMRYCSANNIPPTEVDEAVVDRFVDYRSRCGKPADDAFRRLLARAWNANVGVITGWPSRQLLVPAAMTTVEIEWSEFPERLRQDIDQYLRGLTKVRKSRNGQRIRPLKASTIQTRRAELQAAARMAVKTGVLIDELDSLSALLAPEVAEKVIDAYWQKNGDTPKLFTIDLACRFLAIAKETKCLSDEQCDRLDEMRRDLEDRRQGGITDKNMTFIRQAITPKVWSRVTKLPLAMMAEARRQRHAPIKAAVTAQLAVAIAIESVAPIRLGNLTAIKLDTNLIKLDGPDSNYWLTFPDHDVKNRVKLDFPLEENVTELINEYVHDFRPTLLRGRNEDWLFPGQRLGPKDKTSFSGQIVARIYKATGLRMTVHQFRHAAWGRRIAPPVPDRGSNDCGYVWG
jgi:hypothetical protein